MDNFIAQYPPSMDNAKLLLIDTRIAIEDLCKGRSYPTIGMYGNWCVHPKLTRNSMYHDIIADVQTAYEQCKQKEKIELNKLGLNPEDSKAKKAPISSEPMNTFFKDVYNCFRINELRTELTSFYSKNNIDTLIFEYDHNWKQFIFLLLNSLVNRPLEVPENKKIYSELKNRSEREHFTPVKLMIEERRDEQNKNVVELWWVIEMIARAKLTGKLFEAEFPPNPKT